MASYIAMEPASGIIPGEQTEFVRDGFAFWAFVIPFAWFLWQRMWIEAVAALVLMVALAGLDDLQGIGEFMTVVSVLVSLFIGLEAANLRIAAMRRRGWRMCAVIEAANREEAEARYIGDFLASDDEAARMEATSLSPSAASRAPAVQRRPALGLFDHSAR